MEVISSKRLCALRAFALPRAQARLNTLMAEDMKALGHDGVLDKFRHVQTC
jgi:hypothetical protein